MNEYYDPINTPLMMPVTYCDHEAGKPRTRKKRINSRWCQRPAVVEQQWRKSLSKEEEEQKA